MDLKKYNEMNIGTIGVISFSQPTLTRAVSKALHQARVNITPLSDPVVSEHHIEIERPTRSWRQSDE